MTPNHDFTNAKVGDKIYTVQYGEGTITEIHPKHDHPIVGNFEGGNETFSLDGKYRMDDLTPTAFTEPIKVVPASYEPFQEQEMMVWDDDEDIQSARKRLVFTKYRGLYVGHSYDELNTDSYVFLWQNALPIAEWEAKVKEIKNQKEITEIENQIAELQAKLEKLKG